jgi:outer membrane protein assembly factor BamB
MKLSLLPFLAVLSSAIAAPGDIQQWRGPNRDGLFPATGLLKNWPQEGPPLAWKITGLGKGLASVSVADGKIFTTGGRKGGQFIVALDAASQKELWAAKLCDKGGDPRCTPTVDGGLVFALSSEGDLVCVAATDGHEIWRKSFTSDFGDAPKPTWQFCESPFVDGDNLVVVPGSTEALLAALNKKTGAVLWKTAADLPGKGHKGAGYTGVVVSNAAGIRQYVTLVGKGAVGVDAKTGKLLWQYNRVANGTAVIPTPLVWDDYVFVSSGYGTGAALLKIVKSTGGGDQIAGSPVTAEEQYFLNASTFQNHHGGMVRIGDYIYAGKGHNNGFPICLEWKTGRVVWEKERGPGKESAAVIAADGNLYFRYQDGIMALIEATPTGYSEKGAFKLATVNGPSWPHPVIHGGKLYIRDQDVLMCYTLQK